MPGRSTRGAGGHAGPGSRPLWVCPRCTRTFADRNQTHACRPLGDIEVHFAGKDAAVRRAFDAVLAEVYRIGPVTVLPESTRIALHVRMSFAAFVARRHWLDGHVVLARRLDHPRFQRIEEYSPRNVLHAFRLLGPDDVDADVRSSLAEGRPSGAPAQPRGGVHEGYRRRASPGLACDGVDQLIPAALGAGARSAASLV